MKQEASAGMPADGLQGPDDFPPLGQLRRILVVKFRHLGDVLLTSAMLSALKRACPQAQIDVCLYSDTVEMLENHPAVNTVQVFDRAWKSLGAVTRLRREWAMYRHIRACRYDLVINLTEGERGALVALTSGAPYRLGLIDKRRARSVLRRLAYNRRYRTDYGRRHMAEQNLDAVRRLGVALPMFSEPLVLPVADAARAQVDAAMRAAGWQGGDYVVLHPTSRWLFKCLPTPTVSRLIEALHARGLEVVLSGAPDARERAMADRIIADCAAPVVDLSGRLSLPQLGALIDSARAFVGADSVPMHMAAALDTPVLAWFGPSIEVVWGPWLVRHRLAITPLSCRPCGLDGCGSGKRSECLVQITLAQLEAAFDELVGAP